LQNQKNHIVIHFSVNLSIVEESKMEEEQTASQKSQDLDVLIVSDEEEKKPQQR